MGIFYGVEQGWVEARTKSIVITVDKESTIEVNYTELDLLQRLVEKAQEVRRDQP